MRPHLAMLIFGCGLALPLHAGPAPTRPISTYSIVARDASTGELGVAVQSHWFSVGAVVPWAASGVGAVATQSFVEVSYGPRGLEAMRRGLPAVEALEELVGQDEHAAVRQVAFVDATGRAAAHTGSSCIPGAGHLVGHGYSVQANLMLTDDVPQVMAAAYEKSRGPRSACSPRCRRLRERAATFADANPRHCWWSAELRATNPGPIDSSISASRITIGPWRSCDACCTCTGPTS